MANLTVTLKTVTPMFMAGADGKTPELRAPSIKGALRFWWRAMHGHLSIKKLWEEEGELFGSSDEGVGQSSFNLKIINCDVKKSRQLSYTPHHNHKDGYCSQNDATKKCDYRNGRCMKAIEREGCSGSFSISLTSKSSLETIENIFKITTILGGFGKRSRRGFGSIEISNGIDYKPAYTLDAICKLLNSLVPDKFEVQGDKIIKKGNGGNDYPYIEEIQIGKAFNDYKDLLKVIGKASHDNDCDYTGFARRQERLASPIYVSVIKDGQCFKPIITRLHPLRGRKIL